MKNTFIALSLSILLLLSPLTALAIGSPFGGRVIAAIPCTCNYADGLPTDYVIYGAPFYMPLPLMVGGLEYSRVLSPPNLGQGSVDAPATFSFYNVDIPYDVQNVGDFIPLPPTCLMAIPSPPYCVPILEFGFVSLGLINRVGSSLVPNI